MKNDSYSINVAAYKIKLVDPELAEFAKLHMNTHYYTDLPREDGQMPQIYNHPAAQLMHPLA